MSDSCPLPQAAETVEASDAFASIQVMGKTTQDELNTDGEGNAFDPLKIWKIKKIKEALDRRRRHPTTTTAAPSCASGEFSFSFRNFPFADPAEGLVTGCIAGLSCGNETAAATAVRVITNEAGFGLGEYEAPLIEEGQLNGTVINSWNVSAACEILPRSQFFGNQTSSLILALRVDLGNDAVPVFTCGLLAGEDSNLTGFGCNDDDQVAFQYIS